MTSKKSRTFFLAIKNLDDAVHSPSSTSSFGRMNTGIFPNNSSEYISLINSKSLGKTRTLAMDIERTAYLSRKRITLQ